MNEREHILVGPELGAPVLNVNLGQQLYEQLKKRNRKDIAFKNYITGDYNSVGKVLDDSSRLAHVISNLGVASNDLIAICANNHINYPIVMLAALYIGAPLALMNPEYTGYELGNLFKIINPKIIFCSSVNVANLVKVNSKCTSLKKLIVIDELQEMKNSAILTLGRCLLSTETNFNVKKVNTKEHLAFIIFSSGTTGLPKAVAVTHHSVNATLVAVDHPMVGSPLKTNVNLGVLPFSHLAGFYQIITSITKSASLIVMEHFNPLDYLKCIEKYKIAAITGVPTLLHFLAKSPLIDEYNLSHLNDVTCATAPIGEDILELVKSKFNLNTIRQLYGSTEAHMIVTITPPGSRNFKSVGKVCPGTSICIKDLETEQNLPAHKQGEICTKSDMVMKEYYRNEAATKESFTKDGWLKSGDIGYYDEEGYLYVIDRLKEFIKYKGFQVSPAELELVLLGNPKVVDAGIVGKPDPIAGELPVAFVVKTEGIDLNEDEVKSYLATFLSKHKHLHAVYFVAQIPRTRSGKIIRRELKKLLDVITKSKL